MAKINLDYVLTQTKNDYPYDLLLLADETAYAINKYIFDSDVYLVNNNGNTIGVFCLYEIDKKTVELKNMAVSEEFQNKGVGSQIIKFIKEIVQNKYSTIIVGTADCGIDQIRFYQKKGFQIFDKRKNFFIENYPEPIIENGIQLHDMVLLKYEC